MNKILLALILIVFSLSLSLSICQILLLPSNKTFAQAQDFSSPGSTTTSSDSESSVTSTNDAIIKSILIISQVSVLGISFNHLFFKVILKKNTNQINNVENKTQ